MRIQNSISSPTSRPSATRAAVRLLTIYPHPKLHPHSARVAELKRWAKESMQAAIIKLKSSRLWGRREKAQHWWQVVLWWEVRRIAYNLIVGFAGVLTCAALFGIAAYSERHFGSPLGMPDPPIVGLFAIVMYGIGANVCYTAGWIIEFFSRWAWPGKTEDFGSLALAAGTAFSVILTLAPIALFGGIAVIMKTTGMRI